MRSARISIIALCLVAGTPAAAPAADARADVEKAYAAWDAAFNRHDTKALADAYLPEAKLLPPTHEVAAGPAEIEKFFDGLHANGVGEHELRVIDAGGDDRVVYGVASWSAKATDKTGKTMSVGGIATHVFERQGDGSLRLRLHTFN